MNSLQFGEIRAIRDGGTDMSSITGTHASTFADEWNNTDGLLDDAAPASEATSAQPAIYGRNKETEKLLASFQKVRQTNQSQIVLVHGESGSGKTVLVEMLCEPVCASHGHFVRGKYVQNSAVQEPYSAIMATFSDLCDLIAQSSDERRIHEIQNELESVDVQLLVNAITNIAPFIGKNEVPGLPNNGTTCDYSYIDETAGAESSTTTTTPPSFMKFKVACSTFLRTMASEDHPVVIFLDDVQWADAGSRLLLEMFMTELEQLEHVMFILVYRDEESALVSDILRHAKGGSVDIALSNLDSDSVHEMMCSILGTSNTNTSDLRDLSNLVTKRSGGHPFHIIMFMNFAIQERLLLFNEATTTWIFDVDTIQKEIMVSETLADLLARKIERLSYKIKETLKAASLLEYHFDGSIVVNVASMAMEEQQLSSGKNNKSSSQEVEISHETVVSSLKEAARAGFIEVTREGYHFAHDKLQASFQSLLDEHEKETLHRLIGEAFLSQQANENSSAYNAAVHLNCVPDFAHNGQQRKKLAHVNMKAAKYCEQKSAFVDAAIMLQQGLKALDLNNRWSEDHFDLTFEMMLCLARNQFIIGDFEACRQTSTKETLTHCKTIEMKTKVILIDIDVNAALLEVEDTVSASAQALRTLGVKIPRKVTIRHVAMKLLKVKFLLRHKSDGCLLSMAPTDDLVATTAMKLLMYMCAVGLVSNNKDMTVFSALLAMEITLKRGLSSLSPFAFAIYGAAEISLGNVDCGYRFGQTSLALLDQMKSQDAACATIGFASTLTSCWKEPVRDLVDPLFQAGNAGFYRGDIVYGSYCLAQSYTMQLMLGRNLEMLEDAMRETYSLVKSVEQSTLYVWHQPYLQHTINMRSDAGDWDNVGDMSGEIMNEEEFLRHAKEANNPILVAMVKLFKASEASYFGQFELAASLCDESDALLPGGTYSNSFVGPSTCRSIAQANFESFEITGKRRYLRNARKHMRMLSRMGAAGCPNAVDYLVYLKVEATSRKKSISDAALEAMYNQAIAHMAESDLRHLEGLLSERAGFDFAKRGQRAQAEHYFERADDVYLNRWGAIAKSVWLQEKSAIVLSELYEHNATETPLNGTRVSNSFPTFV